MKKIDLTPMFAFLWFIVFFFSTKETISLSRENEITEITHFYVMLLSGLMLFFGIILSVRNRKKKIKKIL